MGSQSIASFKWTGASGQQIGFAGENPYDKYGPSFTADDVHAQDYDPNAPNTAALPGEIGEATPVIIQDEYTLSEDGYNGWVLDNLDYPWHGDDAGTAGHVAVVAPATRRSPDRAHALPAYQVEQPQGHGVDFYGRSIEDDEITHWTSSSAQASTKGSASLDGRFMTSAWPEPFDSIHVAPNLPVVRPTERIIMRRIAEDDRPTYRQLAVPAQNTAPSGSVYNPTFQSNVPVHNVKPLPAFGRTPVVPWTQEELISGTDQVYPESIDVFDGMSLQ